jgi:hypothetical protein
VLAFGVRVWATRDKDGVGGEYFRSVLCSGRERVLATGDGVSNKKVKGKPPRARISGEGEGEKPTLGVESAARSPHALTLGQGWGLDHRASALSRTT